MDPRRYPATPTSEALDEHHHATLREDHDVTIEGEINPSRYSPVLEPNLPRRPGGPKPFNEVQLLRKQVELLERLVFRPQQVNPNQKLAEIYLPDFDPDVLRLTIEEWCKQVDSLIDLRGFPATTAMMKALSCLRGRAKLWADCNAHSLATWAELKTELQVQFGAESRHIHYINKFREFTSNDAQNYAEYVAEAWRLFSRISPNATDDLLVESVISGIRPKFIQSELLRSTPKTQAELIASLHNYRKRPMNTTAEDDYEAKRKQPRLDINCYQCGKPGHRIRDCKAAYCDFCKRTGHVLADCRSKPGRSGTTFCNSCKRHGHASEDCSFNSTNKSASTSDNQTSKPCSTGTSLQFTVHD